MRIRRLDVLAVLILALLWGLFSWRYLTPDQVNTLGLKVPVEQRERLVVRWGEGCVDCRHTGLYGRTGVFEMLDVGTRVRGLIKGGQDARSTPCNGIHSGPRGQG